jgi:hypothetical protein
MKLIEFPEQNIVIAKDQPEYHPMPAHVDHSDPYGTVTCCWELTWGERLLILFTGRIWHRIMAFKQPIQPQLLELTKPRFPERKPVVEPSKDIMRVGRCCICGRDVLQEESWTCVSNGKALQRNFCSENCAKVFGERLIGTSMAQKS